jgi:light-regulated signal transduction histidine kinase (bacteriophytochrome)
VSACDREPIHVPDSIQPHGVLLVLDGGRIVQASRNIGSALGRSAEEACGRALSEVAPDLARALGPEPWAAAGEGQARYLATLSLVRAGGTGTYDAALHLSGSRLVLELEEAAPDADAGLEALYPTLRGFVEQLQGAADILDLCRLAAADIRRLTGFDRVLVYRFDRDWHGTVVAEDGNGRLPAYLGLRFPASDIPAQARELYRRNSLRIIPDAGYEPVPILPALDPGTGEPLDLSLSVLRSVSPIHAEYMRNMGTQASMSISILRDGALWGLISCHHAEARRVPLRVRDACDFLAQILSLQIASRERAAAADERMRLGSVQAKLLGFMAAEDRFIDGLVKHPDELLALCGAAGAAVVSGDHCWRSGKAPAERAVRHLHAWLSEHHREDVFATESLSEAFPEAASCRDVASGLMAVSISKMHASYILWFRPEVVQTVHWGGDPGKPVARAGEAERLHPRVSFAIWKETLGGRAAPWSPGEIDAVKELRNAVVGIVLRRAEELASLSEELQRSNKELEAFSYSVSHDLRAPFRHVVGFAELLKKQEGDALSDRGRRYLDTIIESGLNAGTLVDNLLSFSQMGRASLRRRPVDMNEIVAELRRSLDLETSGRRITWKVGPLATVQADPIMLRLALENLISNAVKYTRTRDEAVIEIGCRREADAVVTYVRDNGVGFDMAYVGKLFGVFQRLHKMEEFEGSGIGLANVRRIVERHGGRVIAEGAPGRGATFSFALPEM